MTPTQRTLKYLRDLGYTAGVVEKWNPHVKIRQDLFGFVDIVAFNESECLFVQATAADTSTRVKKIQDNEHAKRWLEAGNNILVIGWRQLVVLKKDGTKAKRKRWQPKLVELTRAV